MTQLTELPSLPTVHRIAELIETPADTWHGQCHVVSLAIVRSGLLDDLGPRPRVARGVCSGVWGQHSWIVLGDAGPYADDTVIVDPTVWTYPPAGVDGLYVSRVDDDAAGHPRHRAKGHGLPLFEAGPPMGGDGPVIELRGRDKLSADARAWLDMIEAANGALDRRTWMSLAEGTMVGWPAGEVIAAMCDTPELSAFVPVDIEGMLTDRNPMGVYLAERATA